MMENPGTIAAILVETVCGSGGVLVNPPEVL
jgi:4-aminobutyrate aminotransferase-like enzyme